MNVHLSASPVLPPTITFGLTERLSIKQILEQAEAPDWFMEFGVIRLNGHVIPRENWRHVKVKPDADGVLELCVVPQKGDFLPILATVAVVALAAGVSGGLLGPAGLGLLGSSFAAGGLGATAAGAAIGIAGQLAISMLTAPPVAGAAGAQRDLSQAGIAQNAINLLETLPVVFGAMLVSPPQIIPAYTTLDNDELTVHAIVGLQGRLQIANILLNGTDITLLDGISYETREGGPADAVLTLAQLSCIQQTDQIALSTFRTELESNKNDHLTDQVTPANSDPDYHYLTTDGTADEIWLRYLFPNGIVKSSDDSEAAVPIRIEIRKLGDSTWRKLPTFYIYDVDKATGSLRVEIKLKFSRIADGPHWGAAIDEFPVYFSKDETGLGKSFEYLADSYFDLGSGGSALVVNMTSATTGGITFSSSSVNGANAAWKCADGNGTTYWRPADSSLPAWVKCDFGAGNPKTVKSFEISGVSGSSTTYPKACYLEGSNDDSSWTLLSSVDDSLDSVRIGMNGWVQNPASYRYYRLTITANNGAANQEVRLSTWALYDYDRMGGNIADGAFIYSSHYVSLNENGADVFLDPASWLPGTYEVRVKRGVAFSYASFVGNLANETYGGSADNVDFFDYRTSGGVSTIFIGQKNYRSDCNLEVFSTVSNDVPVDTTGIACIGVELKNTVINSISAEFSSYAPIYSGGVWTDAEAVTANPAALYRHLLLGHANPDPTPGEIIDEVALATWYDRCVSLGYEVNALVQGRSIDEVKRMIAYCGYASPRDTNMVSVAEDYDRSGESIVQMVSPLNAKNLGNTISLPRLPHAIYAEYLDAADDWKVRRDIIYRRGFDVNTASYFDSITYEGFTAAAKVATRAAFDLLQMELRNSEHRYEMGIEGYSITRAMLVGLNDDTLDTKMGYGLIRSITTSGSNVTAIELDSIYAFSGNQDDLMNFVEGLDLSNATGVAIRIESDGTVLIKTATNTADGKTVTFTTPFDLAASGIAVGNLVALGVAGKSHKRMIVHAVVPTGLETRTIVLRDEAPELFA